MNHIYIGRVATTHGIKGELKLLSDFPYKDKIFKVGNTILIDDKEYIINSYRVHKKFDMITLKGYHDINEVECLLRKKVYCKKSDLSLDENEVLDEELLTFKVLTNNEKSGIIKEIFLASPQNKILRLQFNQKEVLVPFQKQFIKKIDKEKKEIIIEFIGGMFDED